jgi:hypothetical protein
MGTKSQQELFNPMINKEREREQERKEEKMRVWTRT